MAANKKNEPEPAHIPLSVPSSILLAQPKSSYGKGIDVGIECW